MRKVEALRAEELEFSSTSSSARTAWPWRIESDSCNNSSIASIVVDQGSEGGSGGSDGGVNPRYWRSLCVRNWGYRERQEDRRKTTSVKMREKKNPSLSSLSSLSQGRSQSIFFFPLSLSKRFEISSLPLSFFLF